MIETTPELRAERKAFRKSLQHQQDAKLKIIEQAGGWLYQLEATLVLLGLAVDVIAEHLGKTTDEVFEALQDAAALIPREQWEVVR